jgi:hypothetical protein
MSFGCTVLQESNSTASGDATIKAGENAVTSCIQKLFRRFVIELRVRLRRDYIFPHCRFAQTLEPCVRGSVRPDLLFLSLTPYIPRTNSSIGISRPVFVSMTETPEES